MTKEKRASLLSVYSLLENWGKLEDRDWGREGSGGTDDPGDLVFHVLALHTGLQLAQNRGLGRLWLEDLH